MRKIGFEPVKGITPADLQSVSFNRLDTYAYFVTVELRGVKPPFDACKATVILVILQPHIVGLFPDCQV